MPYITTPIHPVSQPQPLHLHLYLHLRLHLHLHLHTAHCTLHTTYLIILTHPTLPLAQTVIPPWPPLLALPDAVVRSFSTAFRMTRTPPRCSSGSRPWRGGSSGPLPPAAARPWSTLSPRSNGSSGSGSSSPSTHMNPLRSRFTRHSGGGSIPSRWNFRPAKAPRKRASFSLPSPSLRFQVAGCPRSEYCRILCSTKKRIRCSTFPSFSPAVVLPILCPRTRTRRRKAIAVGHPPRTSAQPVSSLSLSRLAS